MLCGVERLAVAVEDLHFVNAAQVDAAVAALGDVGFQREVEVLEFLFGAEVSVVLVRLARLLHRVVVQDAVLDAPAVDGLGVGQFPAGQVACR